MDSHSYFQTILHRTILSWGAVDGAVVRALASHQRGPGSIRVFHMSVDFVVSFLLCSARFFSGYSGFSFSLTTNISKFQFNPGMHEHF